MTVSTVELAEPTGEQGFLEANKSLLEQHAVKTLLDVMGGSASPEIKLAAASKALEAVGKAKPRELPPPPQTTNIQFNNFSSHMVEAMKGLTGALRPALPEMPPKNEEVEDAIL